MHIYLQAYSRVNLSANRHELVESKIIKLKGLMEWTDEDESPSPIDLLPDGSEEFDIF